MQSYVSGVSPITSSALRDLRVQRFQPGSFVGLRACCYPESWPINHLAHPSPEVAKLWGAECCWKSHGGTGNAGALSGERWKKAHWFLRKLCWCQDCVCWNGFLWMQLRITRMMHIMSNVNSWTVVSSVWFSNACFESMATLLTLLLRFFFGGGVRSHETLTTRIDEGTGQKSHGLPLERCHVTRYPKVQKVQK